MTVENFVQIVWTVFEKTEKSRKMAVFGLILAFYGLIFAMFLTFQSYDFDAFAHAGAPLGVQNVMKTVWTEIFIARSGEKKNKKTTRLHK